MTGVGPVVERRGHACLSLNTVDTRKVGLYPVY
jgi:hypothetical protein